MTLLTINSREGILVTLRVLKSSNKGDRFWNIDNNTLLLGNNAFEEFNDMWGDVERQKYFMSTLTKISQNSIE